MGTYNLLRARAFPCPRCGTLLDEVVIECHFGRTSEMRDLVIGDTYPWIPGRQPQNGGRPSGVTIGGEGYAECPVCSRDFFVTVIIENDTIIGVAPDADRQGYIPD